jgi:hypothetical protein
MYHPHPSFRSPPKKAKLWKFLDFTKFVSLLENRALYFSRSDKLFDPFEGTLSKLNRPIIESGRKNSGSFFFKNYEKARNEIFLNCWHLNEHESAAMWGLYLKSEEGVAVLSNFERLSGCFRKYEENDVYIGKVVYLDYQRQKMPEDNLFEPFVHKRKSFEYENEVRAVIRQPALSGEKNPPGILAPIDICELIEEIYVAPTAENWIFELVVSLVKKYKLGKKVIKSGLYDDPLF